MRRLHRLPRCRDIEPPCRFWQDLALYATCAVAVLVMVVW